MDVSIYIEGKRLDLFKDEKIEINLQVKTVQDIDKIFADFTQSFNVPATPTNNAVFQYWYDNDVDGTFNANLRVDAHIEINSLPFRFGNIQLNDVKLSNLRPESYSIAFFSAAVNLSDLFKDDELKELDLSDFDHEYNSTIVDYMYNDGVSEDLYYPLISCIGDFDLGPNHNRDLIKSNNEISFREFKPALRLIKLIEAIEVKYGVTFSRDFFDRAIFRNLFMWMQREAGRIKAYGTSTTVDLTGIGSLASVEATVNTTTNEINYNRDGFTGGFVRISRFYLVIISPASGYETTPYTVILENDGVEVMRFEQTGARTFLYSGNSTGNKIRAKVIAQETFNFQVQAGVRKTVFNFPLTTTFGYATDIGLHTANAQILLSNHTPQMKVKDFFTSLMQMFNLVITPNSATDFYIDTLDNWYSKGRLFDITPYVDIKTVTVKRPDVKKLIEFKYQKPGAVINEKFLTSNTVAYGDLKATYTIQGSDLKIESKFENLMFERLQNDATGEISEIHAGYSIDKNLQPYNGAPYIFYRGGYADMPLPHIHIQPSKTLTKIYHTATDDNLLPYQVNSSLNFGDEFSTYHYTPVEQGLYYNFWQTYIEDLYDGKTRVLSVSAERLPASIIYGLKLNDKLQFGDKRYKISAAKIDLTSGSATFDLFTDLDAPIDSVADTIALTVDTTNYTVDTTFLTADITQIQTPLLSFVVNGVSVTDYLSTSAAESFDVRISANTLWNIQKVDTGDGVNWFTVNKESGKRSDYVRVSFSKNTSAALREGELLVTIWGDTFTITLSQRG